MGWPIERKVKWGLATGVAVLCSLGAIACALIVSFVHTSNWVIHTHLVIESIQGARTALDDGETAVRGYLLTDDPSYIEPYNLIRERIPGIIDRLVTLTADNHAQQQRMAEVKSQVDREMSLLQQAVEARKTHSASTEGQRKLLDEDQQVMSRIRHMLREARLLEGQLLTVRDAAWRRGLAEAAAAAGALGLLSLVLLGYIYKIFKRDLTERRRAEAALRVSEERLRLMIASVKDYAFYMLDPEGRVATWNEGAILVKGYESKEIIGRDFSTFFTKKDRESGKPDLLLQRAAAQGRVEDEGWRVRKGGTPFEANAITSAIHDEAGHLLGFSEVTRDLTERRLVEEKLRQTQSRLAAILDGSPSIIFVKDIDGRYTLVNRRFEDSFGMTRDDGLGETDMDIFNTETAVKLREHDEIVLATGQALEFEEVIPQEGGSRTYLSARVPLLDENNWPYAVCGVSTDITERKVSEKEGQKLTRALQDRVVNRSAELMQTADQLRIEKVERRGAEERETEVRKRLDEVINNPPLVRKKAAG